ncbi:MAG: hypothetical protein QM638_09510 [Nocardioides sp.]|uniref:hypothetical protein n=1 Tax=Nocardioides sp. TaxID=35761 RepID=UPI0039E547EA
MTANGSDAEILIAISDKPHTRQLRSLDRIAGARVAFPSPKPMYRAFGEMIEHQVYDVAELPITVFLQARAAGKPLLLLPVTLAAAFHHRSLVTPRDADIDDPRVLIGKRIGVRSFSQTTGLWVRAWLEEEYDLRPQDSTWVVTEGSHLAAFQDPAYVKRAHAPLDELLRTGDLSAAVLSRVSQSWLRPVLADPSGSARAWHARHGVVPVNHLVVVTERLAEQRPDMVRAIYRELTRGVEETDCGGMLWEGADAPHRLCYGIDAVAPAVGLAAEYAVRQNLIPTRPDLRSGFVPANLT